MTTPEFPSKKHPAGCTVDGAVILTLRDVRSVDECVEACLFLDQMTECRERIVLDFSQVKSMPRAVFDYVRALCRKQAQRGNGVIIAGSSEAFYQLMNQFSKASGPIPRVFRRP